MTPLVLSGAARAAADDRGNHVRIIAAPLADGAGHPALDGRWVGPGRG
jgi:hypothetical protein